MQTLEKILVPNSDALALYHIKGDYDGPIRRFVFSTRETQDIVNKPEIMGMDYTEKLESAISHLFTGFKDRHFEDIKEDQVNVFHFLRGGLNFGLRQALHRAYGWNTHRASFMSSQRARDKEGRWYITEDSYRKITIAPGSIIFCGDVVATGITLESGLEALTKEVEKRNASIRHFTFFTIGCHKTEKTLQEYHNLWKERFSDYECMDIFYIEGKFHLADSRTPVSIKLQGTDLLRRDSILAPEFIASQEADIRYALERCTIYDAGSRAYDIEEYTEDVLEYWQEVQRLAHGGTTTEQYLKERYPEASDVLKQQAKEYDLQDICTERLATLGQYLHSSHATPTLATTSA
jgi:hypothetical protein